MKARIVWRAAWLLVAWLLAAWLLAVPRLAAAQDATQPLVRGRAHIAMLSDGDTLPDALATKLAKALGEAIHANGHRAMLPDEVRRTLERLGRPVDCERLLACDVGALQRALEVDAVMTYALWIEQGRSPELAVSLQSNQREVAVRRSVTHSLSATVEEAVLESLALAEGQAPSNLVVHAEPDDAEIRVDGGEATDPPAHAALGPGRHTVQIRHDDHVSLVDHLEVPRRDHPLVRRYALEPIAESEAADGALLSGVEGAQRAARVSQWNYILGAGLAAVGLPLLGYGIANLLAESSGGCTIRVAGECAREVETNRITIAAIVGGGLASLGAGALLVLTPIAGSGNDTALGMLLSGQM